MPDLLDITRRTFYQLLKIPAQGRDKNLKCYDEGLTKSGDIKGALPDSYTWGEIKMRIAHAQANSK